jgi:predicted nuclease of restriction endonuclease-like (RecB) superfamily
MAKHFAILTDGWKMSNLDLPQYADFLSEIKQRIRSSQYAALKAVNQQLMTLYWEIGAEIVTKQQELGWGKSVVTQLAKDLQVEFPGIGGFSARNIWNMRNFYVTYSQNVKLQPLVAEIGWTHNLVILEKCKDDLEREFYLRMTRKFGWTKNVLIHQIDNQSYTKTLASQTNFDRTLEPSIVSQARLAIKDEYTFDFLELADEHSERQLEQAILAKVEPFLQEMGSMFSFMGSQYRLEVGDREFFIDLLMYHRQLKALVAIELKIGEFTPEHVGKMQFYLAVLDDTVRLANENPSIGIILCKSKDRTIVEYALHDANKPIGVATYQIFADLPPALQHQLPAPEQIAQLLIDIG